MKRGKIVIWWIITLKNVTLSRKNKYWMARSETDLGTVNLFRCQAWAIEHRPLVSVGHISKTCLTLAPLGAMKINWEFKSMNSLGFAGISRKASIHK